MPRILGWCLYFFKTLCTPAKTNLDLFYSLNGYFGRKLIATSESPVVSRNNFKMYSHYTTCSDSVQNLLEYVEKGSH
jgi:hypothetical protein